MGIKVSPGPQFQDKGTYKEPVPNTDNVRVPRLEVDDATTYIDKDESGNMTFTDAVTGTKTLAQLGGAAAMTGEEIRDALLALPDVNRGVIITSPGSGCFKIISMERLASGAIQITYSDIAES